MENENHESGGRKLAEFLYNLEVEKTSPLRIQKCKICKEILMSSISFFFLHKKLTHSCDENVRHQRPSGKGLAVS